MSVVGIDIGTCFSKVAVAHKKSIQAVPNEISKLTTPSIVSFSDRERSVASVAEASYRSNYKNCVVQFKRFFGRRADDKEACAEAEQWLHCKSSAAPFSIDSADDSDALIGFQVQTCDGEQVLTAEQVAAPFLRHVKTFTSKYIDGTPVKDCVIAVPTFFDDAQRRAVLRAAQLAELKVLRLFNETTAVALNYGIMRPLPEKETRRLIFVDVGYGATQCAVVDFQHGKLQVLLTTHDANLGARDFDRALFDYCVAYFEKANPGIDLRSRTRSVIRLQAECEKVKKMLSANKDVPLHIECFVDEIDFDKLIHRDDLEEMCAEPLTRLRTLVSETVDLMAARDADKNASLEKPLPKVTVHSVEIVGGASRIPSVQENVLAALNAKSETAHIKTLMTTLNGDECVSRGCALMCAMISPNFRVREFEVQDINTWPIALTYPIEGELSTQGVLQTGHPLPCTAKVNFKTLESCDFALQQSTIIAPGTKAKSKGKKADESKSDDAEAALPVSPAIDYPMQSSQGGIAQLRLTVPELNADAVSPAKVKMIVELNKNGLIEPPTATLLEWVEKEVKVLVEKKDDKKGKKDKDKESADSAKDVSAEKPMDVDSEETTESTEASTDDGDAEMPSAGDDAAAKEEDEPEYRIEKKKKKVSTDLTVTGSFVNVIDSRRLDDWQTLEGKMQAMDNIVRETNEMRNSLEAYVYDMRSKCESSHREFIAEDQRAAFVSSLDATEDWIYDVDESSIGKSAYESKLAELQKIGQPILERAWEAEHRPQRVDTLKKLIFKYQQFSMTASYDDADRLAAARAEVEAVAAKEAAEKAAEETPADDATEAADKPAKDEKDVVLETSKDLAARSEEPYLWISRKDKQAVLDASNKCDEWLTNHVIQQDRLPKWELPALSCTAIADKYRELMNTCQAIVTQPKPKPKKKKKAKKSAEKSADASASASPATESADKDGDAPMDSSADPGPVPEAEELESKPTEDEIMDVE
jgi:molecular chaperone DnaK (HSP70)